MNRRTVAAALLAAGALTSCANDAMSPVRSLPHAAASRAAADGPPRRDATPRGDAAPAAEDEPAPAELDPAADLYADPPTAIGPPGTLLRFQRIVGDAGPGTLFRVMYASTDDGGAPIVVTGTVRVPDARPPAAGWPVVAWAHGTTGSADACAPSRTLEPGAADALAADGIVVASTDYAGLGTPGLHPYLDGPSEGRAVIDAVAAAGGLPGVALDGRTAVWGHSQGGHAALFAREMVESRRPELDLVGTVAIAPPSDIAISMTLILMAMQPKAFPALALAGIADGHPGADLHTVLTPQAAATVAAVADRSCVGDVGRAMRAFAGDAVLVARPDEVEPWAGRLADDEPAMRHGSGPLLLIHAADDSTVPAAMSTTVKERTCAAGEATTRWLVPHGGHSGVVADTWPAARRWTLERFEGAPAPDGCAAVDGPPP